MDVSLLHYYCIINKYIYIYIIYKCIYRAYIIFRTICPLVSYSYTKQDEVVDPLTSKIYTVLDRNYVFDMHDDFQEYNHDVK